MIFMADVWFKKKKFGWGYTPCSREGWVVVVIYILLVLVLGLWYENSPELRFNWFIAGLILLVSSLILISSRKSKK